jgi:SagB-type dehydrogenase family enzyme
MGVLSGRVRSRRSVTVPLSLTLLLYFLLVVGTGIFWVAAQDLPVFDWHYLLGYILLLLTTLHVILHWRTVSTWLFDRRGRSAQTGQHGNRHALRTIGWSLLLLVYGSAAFWWGSRYGGEQIVVNYLPPQQGEMKQEDVMIARLYHQGSSYPAQAELQGVTFQSTPIPVKSYTTEAVPLPKSRPNGGKVSEVMANWLTQTSGKELTATTMPLADLAAVLYHSQGVSKTLTLPSQIYRLRTAPSAGALYPVNLYVAVNTVAGLSPGLYYYDPHKHNLRILQRDEVSSQLALAVDQSNLCQSAACTLIMTATFGRTGFKYRERCYRYVNMDTGHAAANAALCAVALGYEAPLISRFDDGRINDLLELDDSLEAALLLMPLGHGNSNANDDQHTEPEVSRLTARIPANEDHETLSFLELIHRFTGIEIADVETPLHRPLTSTSHLNLAEGASLTRLPEPAQGKDLFTAIRKRRSVREFSGTAISASQLSALCLAAMGPAGREIFEPFHKYSAPLPLYLLIRDVAGIEPGIYRYHSETVTIESLSLGDPSSVCSAACLNQEFCRTANVVFVMTMPWKQISSPDGERGYRYACQRAGIMGEGLYLQATALGLGACGVGAFMDGDMANLLGLDPDTEPVLYITAVGK